jgi:phage-related protein
MQEYIASIMNSIWSNVVEIWENIKLSVSQKVENIVGAISEKFTEAKEKATEIFENMKESVSTAFEGLWTSIKGIINKIIGGMETMVNGVIKGINKLLDGVESVANAAGELLGFDPVTLQISTVSLPRLAKGGVVTESTIANIGEDGAEAVVPLERNTQWIQRVSEEMQNHGTIANNSEMVGLMNIIIELLKTIITDNGNLPDTLTDAISTMRFELNNREFARLVKAVN